MMFSNSVAFRSFSPLFGNTYGSQKKRVRTSQGTYVDPDKVVDKDKKGGNGGTGTASTYKPKS